MMDDAKAAFERTLAGWVEVRQRADAQLIPLRLTGSLAVRMHCSRLEHVFHDLEREFANDLDVVSETRFGRAIDQLFVSLGYSSDRRIALATDGQHRFFVHPASGLQVDLYLGKLNYCHPVEIEGRLDADPLTLPLAELLLAKMQIVHLTEKDIKDVTVLLLEHDLGTHDNDTVNVARIADVLSKDWGFYFTFLANLKTLQQWLDTAPLESHYKTAVTEKAAQLERLIEEHPKTTKWKLRARIGTRVPWYQAVEEK